MSSRPPPHGTEISFTGAAVRVPLRAPLRSMLLVRSLVYHLYALSLITASTTSPTVSREHPASHGQVARYERSAPAEAEATSPAAILAGAGAAPPGAPGRRLSTAAAMATKAACSPMIAFRVMRYVTAVPSRASARASPASAAHAAHAAHAGGGAPAPSAS